jgi:hypothetical protein
LIGAVESYHKDGNVIGDLNPAKCYFHPETGQLNLLQLQSPPRAGDLREVENMELFSATPVQKGVAIRMEPASDIYALGMTMALSKVRLDFKRIGSLPVDNKLGGIEALSGLLGFPKELVSQRGMTDELHAFMQRYVDKKQPGTVEKEEMQLIVDMINPDSTKRPTIGSVKERFAAMFEDKSMAIPTVKALRDGNLPLQRVGFTEVIGKFPDDFIPGGKEALPYLDLPRFEAFKSDRNVIKGVYESGWIKQVGFFDRRTGSFIDGLTYDLKKHSGDKFLYLGPPSRIESNQNSPSGFAYVPAKGALNSGNHLITFDKKEYQVKRRGDSFRVFWEESRPIGGRFDSTKTVAFESLDGEVQRKIKNSVEAMEKELKFLPSGPSAEPSPVGREVLPPGIYPNAPGQDLDGPGSSVVRFPRNIN